jgi:ABC-type phosphate transport system substrate-binding protein
MTLLKKKAGAVLAVLAAASLVLVTPGVASAEPSGTPTYRALVAVGSDTIQDVANGLSDAAVRDGVKVFGSYNATNPSTGATYDDIQTRAGGPLFDRPNGSTDGLRAVRASDTGVAWRGTDITGQVDIARSSSGYTSTEPSDLAYIPIGQDAVSWAKHASATALPENIDLGASVNEVWPGTDRLKLTLKNIYGVNTAGTTGTFTVYAAASGGASYTVGSAASSAQIVPFQPQANSGTRQYFATVITGSSSGAFGAHVADSYNGEPVQEHDGTVLAELPARAIVPFSIAQWVAQTNFVAPDRLHGAVLGQVGNTPATQVAGGVYAQNPAFTNALKRLVYFVAPTDRLTSVGVAADEQLQRFLRGAADLGAATNTVDPFDAAPEWIGNLNGVITQYGFSALPTSGSGDVIGKIAGYRSYSSFS